jgi:hypothetical protein
MRSVANRESTLSEPDLQRLLATMAHAALLAADPNPEPGA